MTSAKLSRILYVLLFGACSALNTEGQFASGGQALIGGDANTAASRFQSVAAQDPTYRVTSVAFLQSIWTYFGRAQYSLGNLAEAKDNLEKAISQSNEDHLARLYLGLTLLRQPIPAVPKNPFSLKDVSYALTQGVAPKRMLVLVAERGISFDLTKEAENQLKSSGADGVLLDEIRKVAADNA